MSLVSRSLVIIRAAALVFLMMGATPTIAQADRCGWQPPSIAAAPFAAPDTPVDDTLTRADIGARRAARGAATNSGQDLSYYEASAGMIYDAELQTRALPNGNLCVAIKTVSVEFGIKSRRILIARELASHPCLRDRATRHETRHASIDDARIAAFLPRLRTELERSWPDGLGVEAGDEKDGLVALKHRIDARLTELQSQFITARNTAQDEVDVADAADDAMPTACRDERRRMGWP
jgi:hypothetical protein